MRFRHLLFGATALIALAAGAVDLSADISLRYPESEASARSYNLINSDALLFKQPGMGITVSSDSRNERQAIRPPMAPPAPAIMLSSADVTSDRPTQTTRQSSLSGPTPTTE